MSEFKLERFKYNWKGVWSNGTAYNRDDVVNVGGKTYVCLITHTSSADFNTDLKATVPGSDPPIAQPTLSRAEEEAAKIWKWDESVYQADTADPKTLGWILV